MLEIKDEYKESVKGYLVEVLGFVENIFVLEISALKIDIELCIFLREDEFKS